MSGELARRGDVGAEVGEVVRRLADADLDRGERGRLLVALSRLLAGGARRAGARAAVSGRWLADVVVDLAPHLPVRDLATLQQHHGGLRGPELAEALVRSACAATAGIGAAGGALAAAQHAAPPSLLLAPAQLAAETVAVVAVELKLVAELHVVTGRTPRGSRGEATSAYVEAWASGRGTDPAHELPALGTVLGTAARQQLRRRLVRRFGRGTATLAPFLVGAVAGAELNRRETRALGDRLLADLTAAGRGRPTPR